MQYSLKYHVGKCLSIFFACLASKIRGILKKIANSAALSHLYHNNLHTIHKIFTYVTFVVQLPFSGRKSAVFEGHFSRAALLFSHSQSLKYAKQTCHARKRPIPAAALMDWILGLIIGPQRAPDVCSPPTLQAAMENRPGEPMFPPACFPLSARASPVLSFPLPLLPLQRPSAPPPSEAHL